jgi:cobalt/nickel transport system permease protein
MHIPEGLLSPPVALATGVVSAVGFGLVLRKLERGLGERTTVLMGITAAFIFAAQMVNFPVGPGVTGHLLGGGLAAVMLGPWAGAGVMAAVLLVQCLLFLDGGLTALGANFLNMGLIGTLGSYAIYLPIRRAWPGPRGILLGGMAGAWFGVLLGAGAFALEFAASSSLDRFLPVLGWMVLVHAVIGVGEALITGAALRFVLQVRPDLIDDPDTLPVAAPVRTAQIVVAGLGIALAVAIVLAPIASSWPDGLEWVGARLGFGPSEAAAAAWSSPFADYTIPGLERSLGIATALAGVLGTLVVFGVALAFCRIFGRPSAIPFPSVGSASEGI